MAAPAPKPGPPAAGAPAPGGVAGGAEPRILRVLGVQTLYVLGPLQKLLLPLTFCSNVPVLTKTTQKQKSTIFL